jgi:RNase P subunit RPR2
MEIYCFKCRKKTNSKNLEEVTMKNGKHAVKGECEECGTKTFKIKKASK